SPPLRRSCQVGSRLQTNRPGALCRETPRDPKPYETTCQKRAKALVRPISSHLPLRSQLFLLPCKHTDYQRSKQKNPRRPLPTLLSSLQLGRDRAAFPESTPSRLF